VNDRVTGKRGGVGRRALPHNGALLRETITIDTLPARGPPLLAAAQLYGVRRRPRRTRTRVSPLARAPSVSGGTGGTSCPTTLARPSQVSHTILRRSQCAGIAARTSSSSLSRGGKIQSDPHSRSDPVLLKRPRALARDYVLLAHIPNLLGGDSRVGRSCLTSASIVTTVSWGHFRPVNWAPTYGP